MASIKELKKDIDFLTFEVISDCFTAMSVKSIEKSEELSVIVSEAVQLRNDLIARANNPDGKENPAMVKAYYKKLRVDLMDGIDKLFEKLSKLLSK